MKLTAAFLAASALVAMAVPASAQTDRRCEWFNIFTGERIDGSCAGWTYGSTDSSGLNVGTPAAPSAPSTPATPSEPSTPSEPEGPDCGPRDPHHGGPQDHGPKHGNGPKDPRDHGPKDPRDHGPKGPKDNNPKGGQDHGGGKDGPKGGPRH